MIYLYALVINAFVFTILVYVIKVYKIVLTKFDLSKFVPIKTYDLLTEHASNLHKLNMNYQSGLISPLKSRLYFEAHITIEAEDDHQDFLDFKTAVGEDWKVSRFDEDEVDGYNGKWFASARHDSFREISNMIRTALDRLYEDEFIVIRAKVENTLRDTKYGDVMSEHSIPFSERI